MVLTKHVSDWLRDWRRFSERIMPRATQSLRAPLNAVTGGLLSVLVGLQTIPADAATLQSPTGGQVHALVIGADDYVSQNKLKGAVADANDIAGALRKARVTNVTVLIDAQATRQRVIGALQRLETDAKSGDLVFVSFAGHGTQLPERTPGSNPNGMDEVFVLPGFEARGPG